MQKWKNRQANINQKIKKIMNIKNNQMIIKMVNKIIKISILKTNNLSKKIKSDNIINMKHLKDAKDNNKSLSISLKNK